ncbi:DUF6476 family protein [Jannaschia rubra]|nr:DUF6476 family protein [Jannaschia rubra]
METPEPANLRFLRVLVTVLTAVMIAGVIAIVALLVTRLPGRAVKTPDRLEMPARAEVLAVTQTPDAWLVTTRDGRLLLFGPDGVLRREIPLD